MGYEGKSEEQKEQERERARRYYWEHREERLAYMRDRDPAAKAATSRKWREQVRREVFAHYGGRCACCGEPQFRFLTIDHVENNGREHRRELRAKSRDSSLGLLLEIRQTWPDDIQVLCYNCNFGRARNGGVCPHKE